MTANDHIWIDRDDSLARLGQDLAGADQLALDTESDGFHHYFDKLCLVQISTRDRHYIIDPLAVTSLDPLGPVLADPHRRVVMHAAEQDIMYLRRDHGLEVRGLFDTSVAAQFCGHTRLGLAALLENYFQVQLSKSNQRDDWSVRPLTAAQLDYAVADTCHLLDLADRLQEEVGRLGRLAWLEEECAALEQRQINLSPSAPDDITRVKGWKALPPRNRAILRELLRCRDQEAQRRDRPAFRVASGALLLDVARTPPADARALQERKGFPRQRGQTLARALMEAVRRGQRVAEKDFPVTPRREAPAGRRLQRDPAFEARLQVLRAWRQQAATELGLEPGVVISQRGLEAIAENPPGSPGEDDMRQGMRLWRWQAFSDAWRQALAAIPAPGPDQADP